MRESSDYFQYTESKIAMRNAILGQSLGLVANQALFAGGIVILVTLNLTQNSFWAIIVHNAIYLGAFSRFFTALFAKPRSPKRFLLNQWYTAGTILVITGFITLTTHSNWTGVFFIAGIYLFQFFSGSGGTFWFPILQDFVPQWQRGRFFARLRATWTLVALISIILISQLIQDNQPEQYGVIIMIVGVLFLFRNFFIRKLPEIPHEIREPNGKPSLLEIWQDFKQNTNFHWFLIYIGLFGFFLGSFNPILVVFMKKYLHLQDGQNILISIIGSSGAFVAFLFCGLFVDKLGSRTMFFFAQLFLGLIITAVAFFPGRSNYIVYALISANILVRGLQAAFGIAATSYLFYLMNGASRALFSAMQTVAIAIMTVASTMLSGALTNRFQDTIFQFLNNQFSIFQLIFFFSGTFMLISLPVLKKIHHGKYQLQMQNENRY